MLAQEYKTLVGHKPENDDLDRTNCKEARQLGHFSCSICSLCEWPRHAYNTKCGDAQAHAFYDARKDA